MGRKAGQKGGRGDVGREDGIRRREGDVRVRRMNEGRGKEEENSGK